MNPRPSLLSVVAPAITTHTEPLEFVVEVLARARANGWDLVVAPLDVPMRYVWHWTLRGVPATDRQEVLSANADEVRLRACLQFARERCWPITYDMGRRIHLDIDQVVPLSRSRDPGFVPSSPSSGENTGKDIEHGPRVHAAALRAAGVYVPDHIHDHEEVAV